MTLSIDRDAATVLSPNLKLKHIVQSLPKEVFAKDRNQAWLMVIKTIVAVTLGMAAIAFAPWYLLPQQAKPDLMSNSQLW
jgi:acyl-lipid omega-6 desaturase (Delta-12 desaturase)